jgi:hypothetical protein
MFLITTPESGTLCIFNKPALRPKTRKKTDVQVVHVVMPSSIKLLSTTEQFALLNRVRSCDIMDPTRKSCLCKGGSNEYGAFTPRKSCLTSGRGLFAHD